MNDDAAAYVDVLVGRVLGSASQTELAAHVGGDLARAGFSQAAQQA